MKSIFAFILFALSTVTMADTWDEISKEGKITLGVANERPYGYLTPMGEPAGEAPSIAMYVLDKLGVDDVEVVVTEFGSLIPGLKAGRFDVIAAGMYVNPKRCKQVLFSNPTYTIGEGFLVLDGNPKGLHGYGDVKKADEVKMGVMAGAVEFGYAKKFGVPMDRIVTLPDYPAGVAALKAGRIDALAGTSLTMAQLAQKDERVELALPFDELKIDGESVKGYGAFGFRKGDETLRDNFNRVLDGFLGTEQHVSMVQEYGFGTHTLPGDITTQELCN
ncbi:ectoine/hydroxyectoine ABC transporter substrate-binding protein EhuB [Hahella sp. CR1]|uniref:ectoine/hydroxyectoine ABC transporter substrate-binding protein EhuB n=1 Tax=Hahella sp. CR1 TaxID=2992807 RepID=UPI002442A656|nr:ectoine/hydroxyectoine ABC transporter substrate-binding protein EhuB [Hahella sp. CR1]MDG9669028.1 ectoine/hydroxyectoine ABC transporter substrate-binding protein EhuB [Hahella sp. CR1]